jgi:hypothetical protein
MTQSAKDKEKEKERFQNCSCNYHCKRKPGSNPEEDTRLYGFGTIE